MDHTRPPLAIAIELIKNSFVDAKSKGVKLRYLTEITDANISYCKELMSIVDEVRHLDGIKGNFMVSEMEYLAPATSYEETKPASLIIYSSVREIVEADKDRINQVITNLLSNAIKFTKVGTVTMAAVPNDNEIVVSITDTGAGIDSQILPRLFTKFATKSTTGTGLGLFISKSII